jgi:hypothetical protein
VRSGECLGRGDSDRAGQFDELPGQPHRARQPSRRILTERGIGPSAGQQRAAALVGADRPHPTIPQHGIDRIARGGER